MKYQIIYSIVQLKTFKWNFYIIQIFILEKYEYNKMLYIFITW